MLLAYSIAILSIYTIAKGEEIDLVAGLLT